MRIAFLIVTWTPVGGAQRDAAAIARLLIAAGHTVRIVAARSLGPPPDGVPLDLLPVRALTNHGRALAFAQAAQRHLAETDLVVGFDRLPGLDILFGADRCFAARPAPLWRRLTPRWRRMMALEQAVHGPGSHTHTLILAERERLAIRAAWGTPDARLHLLGPGIDRRLRRPSEAEAQAIRDDTRTRLGVAEATPLVLLIGAQWRTKGLDRALQALRTQPDAVLVAVGSSRQDTWRRLARRLGVASRVRLLGGQDVRPLLLAADLLIHPARVENTGAVIVEALASGLPVLCSAACGYAAHVLDSGAGIVVPEPFRQGALDMALATALAADRAAWRRAALDHAAAVDLHGGRAQAAALILALAAARDG
ncbi:glycosyltransferase family 4 protein [Zavarzinia sp. CC-PAN008]|uniref:glycosyltransferase family 4 protein n=1 Tax=Zavarzinia sp. CC-PAN008 TaxID=3243332 RepID=UPI003F7447F8